MEIMETIWKIVGAIGAMLVGAAFAMNARKQYAIARWLFVTAALFLAPTDLVWQLTTDKPWWFRWAAGTLTAIAVCVLVPILWAWVRDSEKRDL